MNPLFIGLGATIALIGLLPTKKGSGNKPEIKTEKELTTQTDSDNVQISNANIVPKLNENETETDISNDSDFNNGGGVV